MNDFKENQSVSHDRDWEPKTMKKLQDTLFVKAES